MSRCMKHLECILVIKDSDPSILFTFETIAPATHTKQEKENQHVYILGFGVTITKCFPVNNWC